MWVLVLRWCVDDWCFDYDGDYVVVVVSCDDE